MARLAALLVASTLAAGCGSAASPSRAPEERTPHASDRGRPHRGELEREHTGQAEPSIVVRNAFATTQHVFIDWAHVGSIAPGRERTFAVGAGTHTLTSSESKDPDDKPVSVTETFEPGFRYRYEIVPE